MAERPAGKITDEGVARLRERIGVPEPWPLPPHYQRPERRLRSSTSPRPTATTTRSGATPPTARRRSGVARSRRRSMVGGDTLIGEDEVSAVPEDKRDLMKGDPLRGVARVLLRECA